MRARANSNFEREYASATGQGRLVRLLKEAKKKKKIF
jgi:hypothetical protein